MEKKKVQEAAASFVKTQFRPSFFCFCLFFYTASLLTQALWRLSKQLQATAYNHESGWHGVPQTLLSFPAPHPPPRKDVSTKQSRNKETSEPSANKHYSIRSKISGGVFIRCIGGKRSFVWPRGGRKCHVLQCKPDLNALKYDLKKGDTKRLQLSNSGLSEQWASKGAEVFVFVFSYLR